MQVSKTIETAEGPVTFTGELTAEELDMVLSVGLNFLLAQGALPLKAVANLADAYPAPEGVQ